MREAIALVRYVIAQHRYVLVGLIALMIVGELLVLAMSKTDLGRDDEPYEILVLFFAFMPV